MDNQKRLIKLRSSWFRHFKEKSHNVAKTCRYFGISRYTYYFWLRRYEGGGLKALKNRSRKPQTSPRATTLAIRREIIRLRKKRGLGPVKIARLLLEKKNVKISPKTVYLILKKTGLNKSGKARRVHNLSEFNSDRLSTATIKAGCLLARHFSR